VPAGGTAAAGECGHGADCDCGEGVPVVVVGDAKAPEPA